MSISPCETSTRMKCPRTSSLYFPREHDEPLATSSVSCQSGEPWRCTFSLVHNLALHCCHAALPCQRHVGVSFVQRILSLLLTSMSYEQHHTFFGPCFSCAILPTPPSVFRDVPDVDARVVVAFVGNQFMVDPLKPVSLPATRRKISFCP